MHRMYEQWHPLGVVGVISAFNFPVAVWSWNALIAAVCGDCVVWKPSPETPLTAIAVQKICNRVMERHGWEGVFNLTIGDVEAVGERMLVDRRIALISATGSTAMGRRVAEVAGKRLGRTLLELGGNNGVIVMPDADLTWSSAPCFSARSERPASAARASAGCSSTTSLMRHADRSPDRGLQAGADRIAARSGYACGSADQRDGSGADAGSACDGRSNKAAKLSGAARRSAGALSSPRWCARHRRCRCCSTKYSRRFCT